MKHNMLQGNNQGGQQLNIDLKQTETISCPDCGEVHFQQIFVIKRLPKMAVGAKVDIPYAIPLWECTQCGEVLKEFVPPMAGTYDELINSKKDNNEQGLQKL